jgi:3-oxoacyl-[acyl-carrier protein] reductase/meso-butanediol dehydrogenase/(S,S)-butanediol dehydrogenase/diacetyl reductase
MVGQRTAVITGGGKGIGAAIARVFHQHGYHVVIGSRQDNGLAAELGSRALFHCVDVRQPAQVRALMQAAVDWSGRLDVAINNAGYSQWRPAAQVDEEFWQRMIDTNLKGVFFGCQAAGSVLKEGGCIVNISSLASRRGSANNSVYCASKFGVNGITQALAKEWGKRGIRVNAVCPVYVRTTGLIEALAEPDAPPGGKDVESYLADFAAANAALGRLPLGAEVGQTCLFLASPAASAITGQCLNVDCGVLPQ